MADQVQYRRGTAAQHASFTGQIGEATVDTTLEAWRIHDAATAGGWLQQRALAVSTLTGSGQTYSAATLGCQVRRSNGGTAMADAGPSLSTMAGVPAGAEIVLTNADATANLTVTAGASTTWGGFASIVIPAGRSVWLLWDGVSNFAVAGNTLSGMRPQEGVEPASSAATQTGTGNATITASQIYGGILTRSGQSSAVTDTTDTAANIVSAIPNAFVGSTLTLVYINNGSYPVTLTGGAGVTVNNSNSLVVPAGGAAQAVLVVSNITGGSQAVSAYVTPWAASKNIDQVTLKGDTAYQILPSDRTVATSSIFSAPRVWTLPLSANCLPGQEILIEDAYGALTATNTLSVTPSGSDTIGRVSSVSSVLNAAGGFVRLRTDGVSNWSVTGRSAKTTLFLSSGTYYPEPGLKYADVYIIGPGGGGGSGAIVASGTACSGGAGGGTGGFSQSRLLASQIGTSGITVTIGAFGAGGTAPTGGSSTAGNTGGSAGATSLGSLIRALGGGGGAGGQIGANSGGGGCAGTEGSGGAGSGSTAGAAGSGYGAGGNTASSAVWTGGGGMNGTNGAAGTSSGISVCAGSAGGSGGGISAAPGYFNGGGGANGATLAAPNYGNGGAGGTAGGTVAGGNGGNPGVIYYGGGGGGGGASDAAAAGAGGAGGYGAGGGGGGSSLVTKVAGNGGAGGASFLLIIETF
jgi:hypothetical protein